MGRSKRYHTLGEKKRSSAEEVAKMFESGQVDFGDFHSAAIIGGNGVKGKRTKSERVEHKHFHPDGDARRLVNNWMHGGEKRREKQQLLNEKHESHQHPEKHEPHQHPEQHCKMTHRQVKWRKTHGGK